MLRFANIVLSNPAKPDVPSLSLRAVVTHDDFGMSIGKKLAEQLQLEQVALREVAEIGNESRQLMPYVGPLRVTCGGREAYTGAAHCATGVVIGATLARELELDMTTGAEDDGRAFPTVLRMKSEEDFDEASVSRILIQENAIDAETCKMLCDYAAQKGRNRLGVLNTKKKTIDNYDSFVSKETRDTFSVDINGVEEKLRHIFYDMFRKYVEPFFNVRMDHWDVPQLLSYFPGGHYSVHADADRWVKKPNGQGYWERFLDRDISMLLYLNDTFTGGKLNFARQKFKIQPKPGLLVAFPSSAKFRHGAEATESGERLVLVTWSTIKGTPRVREKPSQGIIYMDAMRKLREQS